MNPANHLVFPRDKFCLAQPGESYVVYLTYGYSTELDLRGQKGVFSVSWFNPRTGGPQLKGSTNRVEGGQRRSLGMPPTDKYQDWVVLIERK